MDESVLEKQFDFYLRNQDHLVARYNGRVLVIHDEKVVGDFDDKVDAYRLGKSHFVLVLLFDDIYHNSPYRHFTFSRDPAPSYAPSRSADSLPIYGPYFESAHEEGAGERSGCKARRITA